VVCSPCQGEGRRFEPGVPLHLRPRPDAVLALVGVSAFERFERVSPPSVAIPTLLTLRCIPEQFAAPGLRFDSLWLAKTPSGRAPRPSGAPRWAAVEVARSPRRALRVTANKIGGESRDEPKEVDHLSASTPSARGWHL